MSIDADGPAAPPYDLDALINQLVYPNPVYQLHVSTHILGTTVCYIKRQKGVRVALLQKFPFIIFHFFFNIS